MLKPSASFPDPEELDVLLAHRQDLQEEIDLVDSQIAEIKAKLDRGKQPEFVYRDEDLAHLDLDESILYLLGKTGIGFRTITQAREKQDRVEVAIKKWLHEVHQLKKNSSTYRRIESCLGAILQENPATVALRCRDALANALARSHIA